MKLSAWLPVFVLIASPFAGMAQEAAPQEVPAALAELSYVREEATQWYVAFNMEHEGKWKPHYVNRASDGKGMFEKGRGQPWLAPGDIFYKEGPIAGRFKFTGMIEKEVWSRRTNSTENVKVAMYEDLKPNKKGLKYESQQGLPEPEYGAKAYYDRTAVFALKAGDNCKAAEIKVEELTNFALPPGAASKDFFLKEVGEEKVVVEYKDQTGAVRSATIPKRAEEPAAAYKMLVIPKSGEQLAVLEQLEKLKLTPKGVRELTLGEVIRLLNQEGVKDAKATGVINFVIRGHSDQAPKVTLPAEESTFAAALDEACKQAGFRWTIEPGMDGTQPPVLVLSHPSGKRGGGADAAVGENETSKGDGPSQPVEDPFGPGD